MDPEYSKFSIETLVETARTVRALANRLTTGGEPLPLASDFRANFREVMPDEINGLNGTKVLRALFDTSSEDALLKEEILEGFMAQNPAVPSRRRLVFQVVIRGTQVGIFSGL